MTEAARLSPRCDTPASQAISPHPARVFALTCAAMSKDPDKAFFGHPRGLSTLFFTEMWERLSYYGMRALLVLFMTTAASGANPGLGYPVDKASAIYGLYTGMVYLLALPGGWVADKLWGQRR